MDDINLRGEVRNPTRVGSEGRSELSHVMIRPRLTVEGVLVLDFYAERDATNNSR